MPNDVSLASHCCDRWLIGMTFFSPFPRCAGLTLTKIDRKPRKIIQSIFVILTQVSIRIADSLCSLPHVVRGDESVRARCVGTAEGGLSEGKTRHRRG